jgi:thiol-disulfide isomerase/thioredoxin
MKRLHARWSLVALGMLCLTGTVAAQGKFGEMAPEFPPGMFSDGRQYRLSDLRGKVVVLFFYESKCPRCKGTIPQRNEVVKALRDKPVVFLAVGAGDSIDDALGYNRETGLAMPVFADSVSLMEGRYGQQISLNNIWQFRVIGPDGKIMGYDMSQAAVEKVLSQVQAKWKYKGQDWHAKLEPAVEAFELGQYALGMKLLTAQRRSPVKAIADSAAKLYAEVKKEGEQWKTEADQAAESDPVKAYDLYQRIVTAFPGDDLARSVAESLRKVTATKAVAAELAARKSFSTLEGQLSRLTPQQRPALAQALQGLVKKHPGTPTAEKAAALIKELGG